MVWLEVVQTGEHGLAALLAPRRTSASVGYALGWD